MNVVGGVGVGVEGSGGGGGSDVVIIPMAFIAIPISRDFLIPISKSQHLAIR